MYCIEESTCDVIVTGICIALNCTEASTTKTWCFGVLN